MEKQVFGIVVLDTDTKGCVESIGRIYTDRSEVINDLVEIINEEQEVQLDNEQIEELVMFAQIVINEMAYTIVDFTTAN